MDRSAIASILQELNLNENNVANIYNYGSWVYGTNTPTSDRDILIVTRLPSQPELNFLDDIEYLHDFELHKLWNQYDVVVHSIENFEKLLEKNHLLAVECIFLPNEFKIKEEIVFKKIYLEKYYDKLRLKLVGFYENFMCMKMYDLEDDSIYPQRSTIADEPSQSSKDYLFKNLFHGFRYLDFVQQLIERQSIYDFKSVSHILDEMKTIRGDSTDDSNRELVLDFIREKSTEYKSKLNELISTNTVKGTFEAHITIDCTHNTEQVIEKLKTTCENTKYKIIFINLDTQNNKDKMQQLMTSSYHCGEYPSIVKQIEDDVYKNFQDFNIVRIKIESLASNEGVPQTDMEKKLFWDCQTTYFEFHYKVLVNKETLKTLQDLCRAYYGYNLHLSHNAFKQIDEENFHYMITYRLFEDGRLSAFNKNDGIVTFLENNKFPPLKVVREFVVYDSHIELDNGWR